MTRRDAVLQTIRVGWSAGMGDHLIALDVREKHGVHLTPKAIAGRRQRAGLTATRPALIDRAELRRLYSEGMGPVEIATALGCTRRTAQELLYREGLTRGRGR